MSQSAFNSVVMVKTCRSEEEESASFLPPDVILPAERAEKMQTCLFQISLFWGILWESVLKVFSYISSTFALNSHFIVMSNYYLLFPFSNSLYAL